MSDLREDVARALSDTPTPECCHPGHCRSWPICHPQFLLDADAAIAAVLEHLIAHAYGDNFGPLDIHQETGSFSGGSVYVSTLADWLRSHLEPKS